MYPAIGLRQLFFVLCFLSPTCLGSVLGCAQAASDVTTDVGGSDLGVDSSRDVAVEVADVGLDVGDSRLIDSSDPPADVADSATDLPVDSLTSTDAGDTSIVTADTSSGPLLINEVYVDRLLEGDRVEWLEMMGTPGSSLDGVELRTIAADGKQTFRDVVAPPGTKMPASGRWVVGGGLAIPTDETLLFAFGFDNTRGAIQLLRDGTLVDVLGYGDGVTVTPKSPPIEVGRGSPAILPKDGEKKSIGRKAGAPDLGDNQRDYCVMAFSPRLPNSGCL